MKSRLTFLFQKDAALGDDYWYIAVNVALSLIVKQRDGNIGVSYALVKWYSEDALRACHGK